jgi:hypothetical protein
MFSKLHATATKLRRSVLTKLMDTQFNAPQPADENKPDLSDEAAQSECTTASSGRWVGTGQNPAGLSRGKTVGELLDLADWWGKPSFLKKRPPLSRPRGSRRRIVTTRERLRWLHQRRRCIVLSPRASSPHAVAAALRPHMNAALHLHGNTPASSTRQHRFSCMSASSTPAHRRLVAARRRCITSAREHSSFVDGATPVLQDYRGDRLGLVQLHPVPLRCPELQLWPGKSRGRPAQHQRALGPGVGLVEVHSDHDGVVRQVSILQQGETLRRHVGQLLLLVRAH